jgi:DNA adenine methylase
MARCVKGAIRYNSNGDFNQSPDNRRKGKKPENMQKEIFQFSSLLKNRVSFYNLDYKEVLSSASENDLIYMDPPYQGTCNSKDSRYYSGIKFEVFIDSLRFLNTRNIAYIISYDGKTGNRNYGNNLPKDLGLRKINVEVGRSTQATLLGKDDVTHETLYLSPSLNEKINVEIKENVSLYQRQMSLFGPNYAKNKFTPGNLEALR